MMQTVRHCALVILILSACVGCDQASKHVVRTYLEPGYSRSFLGDTLRLTHAENAGAFLSMGATFSHTARVMLFQVGTGLLIVGLLVYALFWRHAATSITIAFTLLAASGLGNLIDRLTCDGYVTDFLNVGIGPVRTGIFNVADVVGVIGVLMLIYTEYSATTRSSKNGEQAR